MHLRAGTIFHGLFVNPHLSLESGSCEPGLDENPIDGRADRRKSTTLSDTELISENSQRKTETRKIEVHFSMTIDN
jgi:hypothetical protein